jgi:spindle assembly abnormal protein 6
MDQELVFLKTCPLLVRNAVIGEEKRGISINVSINSKERFKTLFVQMTDPTDPYFLFHLQITEEDFHLLKTDQNLLVDFFQFPTKFVELLDSCISCGRQDSPKYILFIQVSMSTHIRSLK